MMTARRVLILAPHPDDEVVACAIAAMRARAAGARLFVLYLTTGVPERAAHWPWQHPGYRGRIGRRRAEAESAARLLGLQPAEFRTTPSRWLRADLGAAARDLDREIARHDADALWVPAFEGGHQDHDAANALAAGVASRLPVWEFAEYNLGGGRIRSNAFAVERGGEILIEATPAEAERKRHALACYASERGNLRQVGPEREACRPLAEYDYAARPHPGRLFRERFQWLPFRHPRVDFDRSAAVYHDIAAWVAARQDLPESHPRRTPLGDHPGG
ncbi:MAG: PIG-L family deacetylase [Acidobacteria bacterium]|nr:PIG-L family deacetylase [Acidobacteriota bacterium]